MPGIDDDQPAGQMFWSVSSMSIPAFPAARNDFELIEVDLAGTGEAAAAELRATIALACRCVMLLLAAAPAANTTSAPLAVTLWIAAFNAFQVGVSVCSGGKPQEFEKTLAPCLVHLHDPQKGGAWVTGNYEAGETHERSRPHASGFNPPTS